MHCYCLKSKKISIKRKLFKVSQSFLSSLKDFNCFLRRHPYINIRSVNIPA